MRATPLLLTCLLLAACGSPTDEEGREIEALAQEQDEPRDIAVSGSTVYWLNNITRGSVMAREKTGGDPVELTEADTPHAIALNSEYLYFGESDEALRRVSLSGGDPASVALQEVTDFALGNSRVFGTTQSADQVWSVPLQGGLLQNIDAATFVGTPTGIIVDADEVFWINRLSAEISAYPIEAAEGASARVVTSWAGNNTMELVANATHLFWADHSTNEILSAPKAGGEALVLGEASVRWLEVDGNHIYFASNDEEEGASIQRIPLEGGETETIAELDEEAGGIAIDATHIYWTSPAAGTVQAVLKEL